MMSIKNMIKRLIDWLDDVKIDENTKAKMEREPFK